MKPAGEHPLRPDELALIDRYWRAANYISVGQIYLLDNPLLREPLQAEHVKPRLLGHWGTTPGLNFVYAHLNRVIRRRDLDMIYVCGPGHGGPGMVANTWLEGSYSEIYPEVSLDEAGLGRLFRQFSFPGGVPSHASPETPGSIHEGGELGYALVHAFGAAFDNPELIVACVVGDGEAETGALAASWHSNKFLNPVSDGAVLPILHLNGYKIANPTIMGRMSDADLEHLFLGLGWEPLFVSGDDPATMHQDMAAALDRAVAQIQQIQNAARDSREPPTMPRWPMIVLRSPKGWTGPKEVDGKKVEGFWRSHQVPSQQCPWRCRLIWRYAGSNGCAAMGPKRAVRCCRDGLLPELQALAPHRPSSAWVHEPARQWRTPQAASSPCRIIVPSALELTQPGQRQGRSDAR